MGNKFKKKVKRFSIAILSVVMALILILIFFPYKYDDIVAEKHLSFGLSHLFGTDYLGRDFFVRICFAMLNTLLISICTIVCSIFIGVVYGTYAGYKGGKTEKIMVSILNVLESIPDFLLAIILLIVFNNLFVNSSVLGIFVTLILISWTQMARIVINETKRIMNNEYVQYSIIKEASFFHILKFHLIPNLKNTIIITAIQKIPAAIFLESFLSFVGVGIQPPLPSLGKMISEGIRFFRLYPHELILPSIILGVVVCIFNVFGEMIITHKHSEVRKYEE